MTSVTGTKAAGIETLAQIHCIVSNRAFFIGIVRVYDDCLLYSALPPSTE